MVLDQISELWACSSIKILFFEQQKLDFITICLQVCCSASLDNPFCAPVGLKNYLGIVRDCVIYIYIFDVVMM
ncbi:hypothetical protein NC652_033373 [Populus alba x Populus x berolinensis]|nr:hypothetical protein NC652_033373 [Populus alba x Populus x berolinensis]